LAETEGENPRRVRWSERSDRNDAAKRRPRSEVEG
jgi:hypothetical protein